MDVASDIDSHPERTEIYFRLQNRVMKAHSLFLYV